MQDGLYVVDLTTAQLTQRAAELKAFARMAPTAQARDELGQLAKYYAALAAQQSVSSSDSRGT
jgi:hypothetical protein